jgi:hypothetical protein
MGDNFNEVPTSRNIPLPIKRAIRQRCGFGCVICGLPLYEYEHMLGWANVHRHVAEEITLLCDQHHSEKTKGLLPIETMTRANANPFNLREGVSSPYNLHYSGNGIFFAISTCTFGNTDIYQDDEGNIFSRCIAIAIDSVPILEYVKFNNELFLNLRLFDEFNECVLLIVENQLWYKTDTWDIEFVGRNLVIREKQRKILIDMIFNPPDSIAIIKGRILLNGVEVLIKPDGLYINGNKPNLSNALIMSDICLALGVRPSNQGGAGFRLRGISRYSKDTKATQKVREEILADKSHS